MHDKLIVNLVLNRVQRIKAAFKTDGFVAGIVAAINLSVFSTIFGLGYMLVLLEHILSSNYLYLLSLKVFFSQVINFGIIILPPLIFFFTVDRIIFTLEKIANFLTSKIDRMGDKIDYLYWKKNKKDPKIPTRIILQPFCMLLVVGLAIFYFVIPDFYNIINQLFFWIMPHHGGR